MEGTAPLKVIVVDDNPDYAESAALLVRCFGHEVDVAYGGAEALRKADAFVPDAMLVDIGMPIMNGYAVAQAVRQRPALHATAVIAVTAYGDAAARDRSDEAGFELHLVKPVDPVVLEKILDLVARTRDQFALEERTAGHPAALQHRAALLREQIRQNRAG